MFYFTIESVLSSCCKQILWFYFQLYLKNGFRYCLEMFLTQPSSSLAYPSNIYHTRPFVDLSTLIEHKGQYNKGQYNNNVLRRLHILVGAKQTYFYYSC